MPFSRDRVDSTPVLQIDHSDQVLRDSTFQPQLTGRAIQVSPCELGSEKSDSTLTMA